MLNRLKSINADCVKSYDWHGEPVCVRRLSAADWVQLQSFAAKAGSEEQDGVKDGAGTFDFYIELLAKCLCDAEGNADCDSDEGRNQLRMLGIADLTSLGQLALTHNGAKDEGDAKN